MQITPKGVTGGYGHVGELSQSASLAIQEFSRKPVRKVGSGTPGIRTRKTVQVDQEIGVALFHISSEKQSPVRRRGGVGPGVGQGRWNGYLCGDWTRWRPAHYAIKFQLSPVQHCSHVIHSTLARKRTGDALIGWRPTSEKNIETMPCWGENSPEKCLVDLGRDTRTSTQSRRLVLRKDASWSLDWPSGANFQAQKQHMYFFLVPL